MVTGEVIDTPRLRLVPLITGNAEALRQITDDPAIIQAISFLHAPFTMDDAKTLIAQNQNGRDLFRGIWRREDNLLAGVIGSHDRGTGSFEIGYWIGTAFQRQGYAEEAARGLIGRLRDVTPGSRIVAECRPENRASWGILERLDFHTTGMAGTRPGRVELVLAK